LSSEIAAYFLILRTSNTTGFLASGQHIVVTSLSGSQGKEPPNINVRTFGKSIPKALRQIPAGVPPPVRHSSPSLCPFFLSLPLREGLKESEYFNKPKAEACRLIIDYYFLTLLISNTTGLAASEQQAVVASLSFSQGKAPPNESVLILGYSTAKAGKQIPSGVFPGGNIHSSPTLCPAAQLPFCEITFILMS
jgi:hypothetical protein